MRLDIVVNMLLGKYLSAVNLCVFLLALPMTALYLGTFLCLCVYVCSLEEFYKLRGHRWNKVEDDHRKSDRTSICKRTTSERALGKSAHNRRQYWGGSIFMLLCPMQCYA